MKINDYHRLVQQPAFVALEAMRRAGLYIDQRKAQDQIAAWHRELIQLERYVEGEAIRRGFMIKYSVAHAPLPDKVFRDFLYSPTGLDLKVVKKTTAGKDGSDDEALLPYAAVGPTHNRLNGQPFEDHPIVYAILKIRSIAKAKGTHLGGLLKWCRADGACHAKLKNTSGTTRPSAEDPPVHQLPERADPEVAKLVKGCIVPRVGAWSGDPAEWDPRKHGWVGKVDVKGAEFVIRAGCLARERALIDYLRGGRDGHAKTASLFTGKPESAFAKGKKDRWYRDDVAKGSNFLLIYGGSWKALQGALWTQSRTKLEDDEAKRLRTVFFGPEGYPDIARQYEDDTAQMVERGYIEDDFGRRWTMRMPEGLRARRRGDGTWSFLPTEKLHEDDQKALYDMLSHCRHCYANRRTQADNATMLLWTLALCHHGEYVQLQLPPTWEHHGLPFPEAEAWELNEGRGPGRKPFKVWITNEVHDSLWLDGAPGTLEPAMMVAFRRSLGLPADLMLDADMLRRVEAEVGPDLGHLQPYEVVAQKFGLAEMPAW